MNRLPANTRCDIFCCVIDNYGDIGVCWRLAKQLANEHQQQVRLWVDDLQSFQSICKQVKPSEVQQHIENVEICLWQNPWQATSIAEIVIEAFACTLPAAYIEAMVKAPKAPLWINLEYLTYEDWSVSCHGLASPQANNLNKYFFFTGLPETGGLIREAPLFEQAEQFQNSPIAQQQFLATLGVQHQPDALLILVFSYANTNLASWLTTLEQADQPCHLLIPQTPLLANLADYLKIERSLLIAGYHYQQGNLTLTIIPFVQQSDFDKLLWCCDINIVRGEDSFVRAQYAAKPTLWHIYPQQEDAHLIKLDAFLSHYLQNLDAATKQALTGWWLAWNNQHNLSQPWLKLLKQLPNCKEHAKKWYLNQKKSTDLATKLANFYKNWLS